ncbi:hypothetical protein [Rhodoferax sp.]|uniref:hypothetical protein n=1 Tax=Rhodoferax sp. TaxID=50421 RepID=UPI002ACD6590|nr:hypothetical protein [Rhodoferax sp.]MDZ7920675.1 hypothetical protein [Rhodoferax sp.]
MKYAQSDSEKKYESLILGRNISFGLAAVMFFDAYLNWNPLIKVDHIDSNIFAKGIFSLVVYVFGPQSEAAFPLALGCVFFINAVVIQAVIHCKK